MSKNALSVQRLSSVTSKQCQIWYIANQNAINKMLKMIQFQFLKNTTNGQSNANVVLTISLLRMHFSKKEKNLYSSDTCYGRPIP